jgi:hypothetical protein
LGIISQIWIPETFVEIGLNSPRISAGASGLGSKVSKCVGPPSIQIKMQLDGRLLGAESEFDESLADAIRVKRKRSKKLPPSNPPMPSCKHERRCMGILNQTGSCRIMTAPHQSL